MNLQEQIGPYLVLRQLSQHERYQTLLAARERAQTDVHSLTDALDLVELLSSLRGESEVKTPTALSDFDPKMIDCASRLLGWTVAERLDSTADQETPLTPWMQRSWSDGISLKELIKVIQGSKRRLSLPHALHFASHLLEAWSLIIHYTTVTAYTNYGLSEKLQLKFDGQVTLYAPLIDQKMMNGSIAIERDSIRSESIFDAIRDAVSLTTQMSLWRVEDVDYAQLQESIQQHFQGPEMVRHALDALVNLVNPDHDEVSLADFISHIEDFRQSIIQCSLDCPPAMISTFLTSVLSFETAKARRERRDLVNRAARDLLAVDSQGLFQAEDDFLGGDERTQATLTVVPRSAQVHIYDALSTDSFNGSDEHHLDLDPDIVRASFGELDPSQEPIAQEAHVGDVASEAPDALDPTSAMLNTADQALDDEDHLHGDGDTEIQDQASPTPNPAVDRVDARTAADEEEEQSSGHIANQQDETAQEAAESTPDTSTSDSAPASLISPRAYNIRSPEALKRRAQGEGINTFDVMPSDDFESIDLSAVQAQKLRDAATEVGAESEEIAESSSDPTPDTQEVTDHNEASNEIGSDEPLHHLEKAPTPARVERWEDLEDSSVDNLTPAQRAMRSAANASSNAAAYEMHGESPLTAQETIGGYGAPKRSRSYWPMYLIAAVLAVVASVGLNSADLNRLTEGLQFNESATGSKSTSSQTRDSARVDQKPVEEARPKWTWPQVMPTPKMYWRISPSQLLDRLPELNAKDDEPSSLWMYRRGHLPGLLSAQQTPPQKGTVSNQVKARASHSKSTHHLTAGESLIHKVSLNIKPKRRDIEVSVNGVAVDPKAPLSLPMNVPSTISITRPNYQSHHIIMRPSPHSPKRISIYLKRASISKPLITLNAHLGSAQLSVLDPEGGEHMVGEKMGRYTYQPQREGWLTLRAEARSGSREVWRLQPTNKDAYTVHFDHLTRGKGKLRINGKARFKATVEPIPVVQQSPNRRAQAQSTRPKAGARLPHTVELDAQEVLVTLTDSIDESQYQFVTAVFANHEVVWQISRERSPIDQSRPWRVDAKRLRQYRGRKRRSSTRSQDTTRRRSARETKPTKAKDLEMPRLEH